MGGPYLDTLLLYDRRRLSRSLLCTDHENHRVRTTTENPLIVIDLTLRLLGRKLTMLRLEPTAVVVVHATAPIVRFRTDRDFDGNGIAFTVAWRGTCVVYDRDGGSASFELVAQAGSSLFFHYDDDL